MMFSWPSPLPTADSGSSLGGVSPVPPDSSELEHATTSAAQAASARPSRNGGGCHGFSSNYNWWTALSGQASVIGVPWCRSGGSHVLAVRTVAVSVTPGAAIAAMRVVGPA